MQQINEKFAPGTEILYSQELLFLQGILLLHESKFSKFGQTNLAVRFPEERIRKGTEGGLHT